MSTGPPSRPTITRTADSAGNSACGIACGVLFFAAFGLIGLTVTVAFLSAPGWAKLAALFPLIFVAIGIGGIWGVTRARHLSPERIRALAVRKRRVVEPDTDLPIPKLKTYVGKNHPVRLSMETAQKSGILTLLFVCLFWNGIVGVFVSIGLFTDEFPWFVWIFLTPFILVGMAILAGLLKQVLVALRVPDTVIELSQEPLLPGETARVAISQGGSLNLNKLSVTVECEEKITYTRGTDTYHENRKVFSEALVQTGSMRIQNLRPWRESLEFEVPANAMHSFHAKHNEVMWKIVVKGELSGWPDYEFIYPFRVMPPGVREQISWKRESLFA